MRRMRRVRRSARHAAAALALAALAAGGCVDGERPGRAVYVLIDTSASYRPALARAVAGAKRIVARARPGDVLAVALITEGSFTDEAVLHEGRLTGRPSEIARLKRRLGARLDALALAARPAPHTDISGALLQAADALARLDTRERWLVIFSDLDEDLRRGLRRPRLPDLTGVRVIAAGVRKLRSDNRDPERYYARLARWRERLLAAGASGWHVTGAAEAAVIIARGAQGAPSRRPPNP